MKALNFAIIYGGNLWPTSTKTSSTSFSFSPPSCSPWAGPSLPVFIRKFIQVWERRRPYLKLVGEAWQNCFEVSSMWIIVEIQYKLEYFYDKKSITKSGRVSLMWIIQLNCLDPVQTWIDCILCTVVLSHVIIQGFFSITLATYHTCTLFCVVCPTLVHEYSSLYWI